MRIRGEGKGAVPRRRRKTRTRTKKTREIREHHRDTQERVKDKHYY